MVGEVYLVDRASSPEYYGGGDGLHLAFNFPPLHAPWAKAAGRNRSSASSTSYRSDAWPTWVLSNHDDRRASHPAGQVGGRGASGRGFAD